jgi:hypothetical protein
MNEMSLIPAEVLEDKPEIIITCTQEESAQRVTECSKCVNFIFDENQNTKCSSSGCNISLMTTFKFKQCPLEKW